MQFVSLLSIRRGHTKSLHGFPQALFDSFTASGLSAASQGIDRAIRRGNDVFSCDSRFFSGFQASFENVQAKAVFRLGNLIDDVNALANQPSRGFVFPVEIPDVSGPIREIPGLARLESRDRIRRPGDIPGQGGTPSRSRVNVLNSRDEVGDPLLFPLGQRLRDFSNRGEWRFSCESVLLFLRGFQERIHRTLSIRRVFLLHAGNPLIRLRIGLGPDIARKGAGEKTQRARPRRHPALALGNRGVQALFLKKLRHHLPLFQGIDLALVFNREHLIGHELSQVNAKGQGELREGLVAVI